MKPLKALFGRNKEQKILLNYCKITPSKMVAVVGRRRIGKTFLIRKTLQGQIDFEMTGYQNATKKDQLQNFIMSLSNFANTTMITQPPKNWLEAFHQLKLHLIANKGKAKKVVFFDELPWIATSKSGFVEALAHFWNDWASENNVLLLVCGSAASWMLKNVVNNKGGLHNRISHTIFLEPFTLNETKQLVDGLKVKATYHQIIELYMIFGGVPYYLSLMEPGKSIAQNIDELLFDKNGKLANEYENLFASLFDNSANHSQIIQILGTKWKGFTRNEILNLYKGKDGGSLSQLLEELLLSGFISKYSPFQKTTKEALFRLSDPYLLFYLHFITKTAGKKSFSNLMKTPSYKSWCGYAFENVCLYHIKQIKNNLGIAKIETKESSFFYNGNANEQGFQIDLLIDRADGIINMCEIKYCSTEFTIDKGYYKHLIERIAQFARVTKSKKAIHLTMITSRGLAENEYRNEIVDSEINGEELFLE